MAIPGPAVGLPLAGAAVGMLRVRYGSGTSAIRNTSAGGMLVPVWHESGRKERVATYFTWPTGRETLWRRSSILSQAEALGFGELRQLGRVAERLPLGRTLPIVEVKNKTRTASGRALFTLIQFATQEGEQILPPTGLGWIVEFGVLKPATAAVSSRARRSCQPQPAQCRLLLDTALIEQDAPPVDA